MIDPFLFVPVALMDGIDADIAGFAIGPGFASFADVGCPGVSLLHVAAVAEIGAGLPQVIQVGHGDRGKALVFILAKHCVGALTELLHRQPVGCAVTLIHRRE